MAASLFSHTWYSWLKVIRPFRGHSKSLMSFIPQLHSLWCIRDVWFWRLEASLIIFRILVVFIPYFFFQMMEKCLSPEYAKIRVNVIPWFFPQFIQAEANRRNRCDCLPEKTPRHFRAISARNSNSKYPILIPLPKKSLKWFWAPKFRGLQSPLTIGGMWVSGEIDFWVAQTH